MKEYKNISMTRLLFIFAAGCINNLLYLASNLSEHNTKTSLKKIGFFWLSIGSCSGLLWTWYCHL